MLVVSGLSTSNALSLYGVFSGMAIPLIMFPSAFTGSAASLLLPSVSEAQAQGNDQRIRKTICLTMGFCFLLGVFCFLFFFTFAELLGEVVTDSTKKNLEMRVEAENGATAGKTDLAKRAKAANLDAIHDTVHEMARDEARHGKAFAGLLKRYFG